MSQITQSLLGIYMQGLKSGWIRCNNKWLELLSKIARAYKTDFTHQDTVSFMNVQL